MHNSNKMRQTITIFFFISIALTSFSQTQLEMNQSTGERYSLADKELNRIYNQILVDYKNDSNFIEKLKVSQRLWIKFRDAELEMKFPEPDKRFNYGSMYPMCAAGFLTELTKQRTEKLKEWLKPIPEGEGCVGSVKFRETNENDISIKKIENFEFQRLLNGIEILKEFKTADLSVRIMIVGNLSGSAGFANGEITDDLYFAVSEFDELPEQNLFRVSEFYNPKIETVDTSDNKKPVIKISFGKSGERQFMIFEITINELKTSR